MKVHFFRRVGQTWHLEEPEGRRGKGRSQARGTRREVVWGGGGGGGGRECHMGKSNVTTTRQDYNITVTR